MSFQVIGLSGKAGTGKDYIAQNILAPLGYYQFSFAWHLKIWAIGRGDATYEEVFVTKPPHVRKLLQEDGTERGRMVYGEDVWLRVAGAWMRTLSENMGIKKFVIPDVRFFNEADYIKSLGGKVFRVHAPERDKNSSLSAAARLHKSETEMDLYTRWNGWIYNDYDNMDTFEQVHALVLDQLSPHQNAVR